MITSKHRRPGRLFVNLAAIFGLVVLMRTVVAVNSIFNGYAVMTTADGMPLDTFAPGAAQSLLSLWALMAVGNLTRGILSPAAADPAGPPDQPVNATATGDRSRAIPRRRSHRAA